MTGDDCIILGIALIGLGVILFVAFQFFIRKWIKGFMDTWKKY